MIFLLFKTNGVFMFHVNFPGCPRCFFAIFGWKFFNMHDLGGDSLQVIHAEIRAVADAICSKKDLVKVAPGSEVVEYEVGEISSLRTGNV